MSSSSSTSSSSSSAHAFSHYSPSQFANNSQDERPTLITNRPFQPLNHSSSLIDNDNERERRAQQKADSFLSSMSPLSLALSNIEALPNASGITTRVLSQVLNFFPGSDFFIRNNTRHDDAQYFNEGEITRSMRDAMRQIAEKFAKEGVKKPSPGEIRKAIFRLADALSKPFAREMVKQFAENGRIDLRKLMDNAVPSSLRNSYFFQAFLNPLEDPTIQEDSSHTGTALIAPPPERLSVSNTREAPPLSLATEKPKKQDSPKAAIDLLQEALNQEVAKLFSAGCLTDPRQNGFERQQSLSAHQVLFQTNLSELQDVLSKQIHNHICNIAQTHTVRDFGQVLDAASADRVVFSKMLPAMADKLPRTAGEQMREFFVWLGDQFLNLFSAIYYFFANLCKSEQDKIKELVDSLKEVQTALESGKVGPDYMKDVFAAIDNLPLERSYREFQKSQFDNFGQFGNDNLCLRFFISAAQTELREIQRHQALIACRQGILEVTDPSNFHDELVKHKISFNEPFEALTAAREEVAEQRQKAGAAQKKEKKEKKSTSTTSSSSSSSSSSAPTDNTTPPAPVSGDKPPLEFVRDAVLKTLDELLKTHTTKSLSDLLKSDAAERLFIPEPPATPPATPRRGEDNNNNNVHHHSSTSGISLHTSLSVSDTRPINPASQPWVRLLFGDKVGDAFESLRKLDAQHPFVTRVDLAINTAMHNYSNDVAEKTNAIIEGLMRVVTSTKIDVTNKQDKNAANKAAFLDTILPEMRSVLERARKYPESFQGILRN